MVFFLLSEELQSLSSGIERRRGLVEKNGGLDEKGDKGYHDVFDWLPHDCVSTEKRLEQDGRVERVMAATKRKQSGHRAMKKKVRKVKDAISLKEEKTMHHETQEGSRSVEDSREASGLLSAALLAELGDNEGAGGAFVLPGHREKKQKADTVPKELLQQVEQMSKSKRKKLDAIAARKVKETRRASLYKSLAQNQLSSDHMKLLYSTSQMGHKETLRQRLQRSLNRQKAGLELSQDAKKELYPNVSIQNKESIAMKELGKDDLASKFITPSTNTTTIVEASPLATLLPSDIVTTRLRKRGKKAVPVLNRLVPMVSQDKALETRSEPLLTVSKEFETPQVRKHVSSQTTAVLKLEALRLKNEEKRRNRALGTTNTIVLAEDVTKADVYVPQVLVLKTAEEMRALSHQTSLAYKTTLVTLSRKPAIELARMQLPVCSSEQEIMEAINEHDVLILCGETGSGKTTQVPQFLYEAGYGHPNHPSHSGRIGVTQPRRVAAVSTAKRVAEELNVSFGAGNGHVGYQIRFDAEHMSDSTRIKFMTDGILLKEIQEDFLLRQYSILLLDEAHERNVNTDILIGLLSRIAPLRAHMAREEEEALALLSSDEKATRESPIKPLKLVIMSATLRVEDFTQNRRLFPTAPPVLRIDARQYPVTVHFNKRTELDNYVDEAYKKVIKIHKKLPDGGVLIFLTGQREILQLCRKLRHTFTIAAKKKKAVDVKQRRLVQKQRRQLNPILSAIQADVFFREHDEIEEEADVEEAQVYGHDMDDDDNDVENQDEESEDDDDEAMAVPYMHVLPLYSLLPQDEQMKVFETPPTDHRLIVIATNVAETSLTIPNIKYVVDAGRTKARIFDLTNGISSFQIQWISKASADQRAGRAGRTGPGHCYRLYSSAVFDTEFPMFSTPEILCHPIDDLVLQMKAMGIHHVSQFPFPTPPDRQAVHQALQTLVNLGAVSSRDDESITGLGRALVQFPVAARFAKMLLLAQKLDVVEYMIAIVAGLSGPTPFIHARDRRENDEIKETSAIEKHDAMEMEWREAEEMRKHAQWIDEESDVLSLLRAAGAYAFTGGRRDFCVKNHLHEKTMQQMLQLRHQLTRIVNRLYKETKGFQTIDVQPKMPPPDVSTQGLLRQIVAAGFLDHVAKRVPAGTITEGTKLERNCAYLTATASVQEPVYIHPHSSVFTPIPNQLPSYVVYQHIMKTSRPYMKMVTAIEPEWLASIGLKTPLCKYGAPLAEPLPFYDANTDQVQCYVKPQYGIHQWVLPAMCLAYPDGPVDTKDGLRGKYRWFAKFLLDGQVIASFLPFSKALKEPSHTIIRKTFDKKIQFLVVKLQEHEVASRRALVMKWKRKPDGMCFLKTELQNWIKESHSSAFCQAWPSLVRSAVQLEDTSRSFCMTK
ncbi:hypothetical protein CCR75_005206 [Bremia lactucae]|uniref:RNA helicase n=1 Tax=Bremia lactucae TaxID=4779 RepID=A0A976IMB9_BRELC|nr:hypothetical protein CCR75_005206 [Bremia lactucae]